MDHEPFELINFLVKPKLGAPFRLIIPTKDVFFTVVDFLVIYDF